VCRLSKSRNLEGLTKSTGRRFYRKQGPGGILQGHTEELPLFKRSTSLRKAILTNVKIRRLGNEQDYHYEDCLIPANAGPEAREEVDYLWRRKKG